MCPLTTGVIYLWDVSSNALIGAFAQAGAEAGVFPSPCSPGVCVWGGGCHRSPTSAEVASTPRSQGGSRASRRAPVPTARQSPRFRRSTRVRPGECQKASEERDTPTSPRCCRSLGNRGVRTGRPRDSAPRPPRLCRSPPRRGATRRHPESREGKTSSRRDSQVAPKSRGLTLAVAPQHPLSARSFKPPTP